MTRSRHIRAPFLFSPIKTTLERLCSREICIESDACISAGKKTTKLQSEVMQMISLVHLPNAPVRLLTADGWIKQKDQ